MTEWYEYAELVNEPPPVPTIDQLRGIRILPKFWEGQLKLINKNKPETRQLSPGMAAFGIRTLVEIIDKHRMMHPQMDVYRAWGNNGDGMSGSLILVHLEIEGDNVIVDFASGNWPKPMKDLMLVTDAYVPSLPQRLRRPYRNHYEMEPRARWHRFHIEVDGDIIGE